MTQVIISIQSRISAADFTRLLQALATVPDMNFEIRTDAVGHIGMNTHK